MKTAKSAFLFFVLIAVAGAVDLNARPDTGEGASQSGDTLGPANRELTQEAILYHQKLTAPLADLKKANFNYMQTVTKLKRARTIEKKRQELLKVILSNKDSFKSNNPFHGDSTLKSELIRYLDLVYIVLK